MIRSFGKRKLIRDISANTLQTGVTQVFGLLIFYFTSKYLGKADFGELNWSMAVGSTMIAIGSLGLDLIFVRRVATGKNVLEIAGIHFFHTVIIGIILSAAAFASKYVVPGFTLSHPLFLLVFLNLAIANVANSFKLCLNGLEAYRKLAVLAIVSNTCKFLLILVLYILQVFDVIHVIFAYTAVSVLEFVVGYFLMNRSIAARVKPLLRIVEYKYFIMESLPQLGVVLFDSALARIDWILLGILSTAVATAEYSFAYRIFELSKLPLLVIAPVLLTRFSKMFNESNLMSEQQKKDLNVFLQIELFVIMIIPIMLVCTWTPLMDFFTDNKYGAVNETNFMILAACVPLSCLINFLWTLGFVQGQLKTIMFVTISVSILNVLANGLLIPLYGGRGASFAFLFCTIVQSGLYLKFIDQKQVRLNLFNALKAIVNALISVVVAKVLTKNIIFAPLISLSLYTLLTLLTGQIKIVQLKSLVTKRD